MHWDRLFDDLEDQIASEWEAERAVLDSETERLRFSRVSLRERLAGLCAADADAPAAPSFELSDGSLTNAAVVAVGADWVALAVTAGHGQLIVPIRSIVGIGMPHPALLSTVRPPASRPALSDRLTFGFVMRDLVRRRIGVAVRLTGGRVLSGTIDRAGADHLDLAQHEPGTARRSADVTGYRLVPFAAVAAVRIDGRVVI